MKISAIGRSLQTSKTSSEASLGFRQAFLGSKFYLAKPALSQKELDDEAAQAQKARQGGVNVPKYRTKGDALHIEHIRYETKGDPADVQTNPLRYKHLRNLYKNFYFMDRAGIFHKNLGAGHIFLQSDGQVEFDCFRDTVNFYQRHDGSISQIGEGPDTPDFILPSSEDGFRAGYLSEHLMALEEDDRNYFMKNYLNYASEYHQKRAELLARRGTYKAVEYETVLSEVYAKPSRRVVSFEIDKTNAAKQKMDALLEWEQTDGGKKPDTIDPKRRFGSILMQLDYIKNMANLRDVAEYFSKNSMTQAERKYFNFEEELAQKRLETLFDNMENMGALTFFDPDNNMALGSNDEKEFFLELCDEVDFSNSKKAEDTLEDIKEYYTELKDRWDKGLNKSLMEEYQSFS